MERIEIERLINALEQETVRNYHYIRRYHSSEEAINTRLRLIKNDGARLNEYRKALAKY